MTYPPLPPDGGPPWSNPYPSPPQSKAGQSRWIILGIAFLVIVALVVGIVVWKNGFFGSSGGSSNAVSGGGDRTIGLLREKDPVCDDWLNYADELAVGTKAWSEIDKATPASDWTSAQQVVVDEAVDVIATAADRFESILPNAQSIVLQELIAQTIVYWRAYLDKVSDYVESDSLISGVAGNFGNAVNYMCGSVPLMTSVSLGGGQQTSFATDPSGLVRFMSGRDDSCGSLKELTDERDLLLGGWLHTDPSIPASKWSPEQRKLNTAVQEVLTKTANKALNIAAEGKNPIFSDLLVTYSAYIRAYSELIPQYTPDNNQLWRASISISGGLNAACEAVG